MTTERRLKQAKGTGRQECGRERNRGRGLSGQNTVYMMPSSPVKVSFFLGMWPLIGCPCSGRWPDTHVYAGDTVWIQWVRKNKHTKLGDNTGEKREELGCTGEEGGNKGEGRT